MSSGLASEKQPISIVAPGQTDSVTLKERPPIGKIAARSGKVAAEVGLIAAECSWKLKVSATELEAFRENVQDVHLTIHYTFTAS